MRHHALVRDQLGRYRGREVDIAGDGFFAVFDGPARAVRCAQAIVASVRSLDMQLRAAAGSYRLISGTYDICEEHGCQDAVRLEASPNAR